MNTTTTVTENELNWFAAEEIAWGCIHYVSIAYFLPVNAVIGFCENVAILYVLFKLKTGIGESARFYYSLLAVFNLLYLLVYDVFSGFITYGLHAATLGRFYFSAIIENEWLCKICSDSYIPLAVLVTWTYVLLNVERVFAIAWPLKAKIIFTARRNSLYIFIVGAVGVAFMIYVMSIQEIGSPTV